MWISNNVHILQQVISQTSVYPHGKGNESKIKAGDEKTESKV